MASAGSSITLKRSIALAWRSFRSMRTALILLFLLAAGAIAGSLVPQVGVSDPRITQMFIDHPLRASIYQRLDLFEVYGSWWFTMIYSLLMISLAACIIPRTRALFRNMRAKPQVARELDAMRFYAEREVPADPARAIERSRKVLRRKWFRVSPQNGDPSRVAADKGLAREAGSLLFHWSIFVLLIGLAFGKGTGFTGSVAVAEGGQFVDSYASYDGNLSDGVFVTPQDHTGVGLKVDSFQVIYNPDLSVKDYVTKAALYNPNGSYARTVYIRPNHPGSIDGVNFYQMNWGWAPLVDVSLAGQQVASSPLLFQQPLMPKGTDLSTVPWQGVLKLPGTDPQTGIVFTLWPDSQAVKADASAHANVMPMLVANHPLMLYTVYQGDLNLGLTQGPNELITSGMKQVQSGYIFQGQSVKLPDGLSMSFPELRTYTVLKVARDRGTWIMLIGAILILAGLIPALYTSRRKVWVNAEPNGSGATLKVGGFALQRRSQFEEEFAKLVEELSRTEEKVT
jgi:cytochrome c biogenesis protein